MKVARLAYTDVSLAELAIGQALRLKVEYEQGVALARFEPIPAEG